MFKNSVPPPARLVFAAALWYNQDEKLSSAAPPAGMEHFMGKTFGKSLSMLIAAMVLWGTIGLFRRAIPLSSGLVAFSRGVIGALFLALLAKCRGRRLFHGIGRRKTLRLVLSGAVMGINWILLFEAYRFTSVSVATLCYYMEPTFLILASPLFLRERLTAGKGLCAGVSLLGMALVSGVFRGAPLRAGEWRGILLGLGAALLYTAVVLLNKGTAGVDPYEKTVLQLSAAAAALTPYLLVTEDFSALSLSGRTAGMLLLLGILHTGAAYALYFGSMEGLRAQTIAIFSYMDPVTALLLSALLLSERLSAPAILGAVLILASALLSELTPASPAAP